MDFKDLSKARYSLRKYASRQVEDEKLALILEAGRNAPTARNNQPQHIFVIRSEDALEKADACMGVHFHSPVLLVVMYDASAAWSRAVDGKNHGEIDATICATQMMLQATDLGLGTTYVGMFEIDKLYAAFPEMQRYIPTAILTLGYPQDGAHPSRLHSDRKPIENMVHFL